MFWKKKNHKAEKKRSKYRVTVDSENLAFPEIHIKPSENAKKRADDIDDKGADESITYENVAIPEIHIRMRERRQAAADKVKDRVKDKVKDKKARKNKVKIKAENKLKE